MDLITDISQVESSHRGAVAALGNFDGIHPGHQVAINRAGEEAKKLGAPHVVIAFEPHPRQYFRPNDPPFRLTSLRAKALILETMGVDGLIALPFVKALAETAAEDFVREILVGVLGIRHLVIGADFRFGKDRGGDADLVRQMAASLDFGVSVVDMVNSPLVSNPNQPYSSTQIRDALRDGEADRAAQLLGRPWSVDGIIVKGNQRGRTIGFPTINVRLGDYLRPKFGGYVFRVDLLEDTGVRTFGGVGNVGVRPTFKDKEVLLEVFMFDFDEEIYGHEVFIHFIDFIRPELKFDSIEALKAQITADCDLAKRTLAVKS